MPYNTTSTRMLDETMKAYVIPTVLSNDYEWKPKLFGFHHKWAYHCALFSYRGVEFYVWQIGPFRIRWIAAGQGL